MFNFSQIGVMKLAYNCLILNAFKNMYNAY